MIWGALVALLVAVWPVEAQVVIPARPGPDTEAGYYAYTTSGGWVWYATSEGNRVLWMAGNGSYQVGTWPGLTGAGVREVYPEGGPGIIQEGIDGTAWWSVVGVSEEAGEWSYETPWYSYEAALWIDTSWTMDYVRSEYDGGNGMVGAAASVVRAELEISTGNVKALVCWKILYNGPTAGTGTRLATWNGTEVFAAGPTCPDPAPVTHIGYAWFTIPAGVSGSFKQEYPLYCNGWRYKSGCSGIGAWSDYLMTLRVGWTWVEEEMQVGPPGFEWNGSTWVPGEDLPPTWGDMEKGAEETEEDWRARWWGWVNDLFEPSEDVRELYVRSIQRLTNAGVLGWVRNLKREFSSIIGTPGEDWALGIGGGGVIEWPGTHTIVPHPLNPNTQLGKANTGAFFGPNLADGVLPAPNNLLTTLGEYKAVFRRLLQCTLWAMFGLSMVVWLRGRWSNE